MSLKSDREHFVRVWSSHDPSIENNCRIDAKHLQRRAMEFLLRSQLIEALRIAPEAIELAIKNAKLDALLDEETL